MEELQTDTLSNYEKNQNKEEFESSTENENAGSLLNGGEEVDDPLDLMADHCDNESIGSNSDVWKGSDSEDENFENREISKASNNESEKETDKILLHESNDTQAPTEELKEQTDTSISLLETSDETKNDTAITVSDGENPSIIENKDEIEADEVHRNDDQNEKKIEDVVMENDDDKMKEVSESSSNNDKSAEVVEEEISDCLSKNETSAKVEDSGQGNVPGTSEEKDTDSAEKTPEEESTSTYKTKESEVSNDVIETNDTGAKDLPVDDVNKNLDENMSQKDDQDDECQLEYDAEDDDDFDPSLLCPEVSMAVDDNPVVTINGGMPNDGGSDSPLPYEPLFSTFVDEVTGAEISFNLTGEEQELRRRLYGPTNPIQITRIHCTACNVHLGSALEGQNNRFVHPLLKALICKECYHFYTSGEFEKDEDGSELYCRWCGQGGQVLCCSKCEFVFCKRCIRTNFGRKKMLEIRDSDNWDCFRCNPQQIITQRIACYEFFEYVRREMSRTSTHNSPEIWSKDHTRCCTQKKRPLENGDEMKDAKKKRRKSEVDPDYNPLAEKPEVETSNAAATTNAQYEKMAKAIILPKPIQLVPRYKPKDNDIEFVRQIPAPRVTINPTNRPTYRTILPTNIRPALQPTLLRISAQPSGPPHLTPTNRILGTALQGRNVNTSNMMKHEWFEKTVRAAARVNSHLSYTLTQLNKAQSQAASVEELAVVHNKLQEILSSSINSLIQIRKNLRTEFIAGIKTVRLPSKKADTTSSNDDDVIFVSAPTTMAIPSSSGVRITPVVKTSANNPIIIIDKSAPTTSVQAEWPKGYLKVKSVTELQNVPAECITIPDDPPEPDHSKDVENSISKAPSVVDITFNGVTESSKDVDPLAGTPGTGNVEVELEPMELEPVVSKSTASEPTVPEPAASASTVSEPTVTATIDLSEVPNEKNEKGSSDSEKKIEEVTLPNLGLRSRKNKNNNLVFNVKSDKSPEVKRMMSVTVNLQKADLMKLQKQLTIDKQ